MIKVELTKEDLKTLIHVEDLLHRELEKGNYDYDSMEWGVWNTYWNLVEKICYGKDMINNVIKYVRELQSNAPEEECFDKIIEMLGGKEQC